MQSILDEIRWYLVAELEVEEAITEAIGDGRIKRQSTVPIWEQTYGDPRS